ncbi:MAG: protein kinase [Geothrix sp.]|uniref:serine/threonine protein kinase n=1 Tax=Geothrix sp. TaxID=1962974 RepID=UPI0017F27BF0|nr:serine/threonine-protein kinase [Geothrix sp.]NWJ41158.1 protein kinase [Geothrix sp.]WIL20850.1 MAG: protein kinase [Geothrix sp.]
MFEKLGKFEIKRVLGNGAMGEVYLGVDPSIGREVAIKTILPAAAQGGEAKERFAREARAAGVLNHPNLVTIYEFGEDQGVLYIAMEYVKGHDLEELLQDHSLTRSESLEILAQVCDGLGFAHRQQIVHRDIKPTNVRVQRDGRRLHAKVMDFGVAKISNSDMTATGMVMGTVSYMAPEYIRFGKPDPRSDLFAVGVMLYESLSGRKPFAGDTTPTVLYKIVNEPPDPIETEKLQGISPAIRTVLDRALCKNPEERYQTAEDLAKALRAAKDPSWMGQVDEATTLMQVSAPTAAARAVPANTTLQVPAAPPVVTAEPRPAPRPAGSGKGLWIGIAALGLLAVTGATWWTLKDRASLPAATTTDPKVESAPAPGEVKTAAGVISPTQAAIPSPGISEPQGTRKPAAPLPSTRPDTPAEIRPEPARPTPPKTAETKPREARAIDQPELYQPEKLDKLQVHERMNLGNVSLSEAIQMADSQPEKAIQGFRQAIKADPTNVNAHAWLAVVLYDQGRTSEFVQELREARRQGILGQMAARNLRFKSVLNQARFSRKLPADLAD